MQSFDAQKKIPMVYFHRLKLTALCFAAATPFAQTCSMPAIEDLEVL